MGTRQVGRKKTETKPELGQKPRSETGLMWPELTGESSSVCIQVILLQSLCTVLSHTYIYLFIYLATHSCEQIQYINQCLLTALVCKCVCLTAPSCEGVVESCRNRCDGSLLRSRGAPGAHTVPKLTYFAPVTRSCRVQTTLSGQRKSSFASCLPG